ncbi:MAG TPA: right-handed parallel beta-helix repeat-containing protein [Stellaceae bacterium]|jgi:hypothetical protein|nr:right-handed parallel beta-helix repeat-containing protein [Stellaceae bacterium]
MKQIVVIAAAIGCALAAALPATAAAVQNTRSFVSAQTGVDTNPCTRTSPCRSFAVAITQTSAGGEIDTLDPGGYGDVTINKAISIVSGLGDAGVLVPSGGTGITINAGPNDIVYLRGLFVEGAGVGQAGIVFNSGKLLTIESCVIRHVTDDGIDILPTAASAFAIANTVASDNGGDGIYIAPHGAGAAQGAIADVAANNNNYLGIAIDGQFTTGTSPSSVSIVRSVAANNLNTGVSAQNAGTAQMSFLVRDTNASHNGFAGFVTTGGATMRLAHSVATGNSQGVSSVGTIDTYGDNDIDGNTTIDINATLSTLAMH